MNIHAHLKQLDREMAARGLTSSQVAAEAGYSDNLIHTWRHQAKMGEGKKDTKEFNQKRRESLAKVQAVLAKHRVKYSWKLHANERAKQLSLPLSKPHQPRLKGNGHDKAKPKVSDFKTWDPNHGWVEANPPKMLAADKPNVANIAAAGTLHPAEPKHKWAGSVRRAVVLRHRDTACETLQKLINERLARMSAVQLALLLAHIAGEG